MQPAASRWTSPSEAVTLSMHEVHIWRTSLARSPQERAMLAKFLNADEVEKANSFASLQESERWIVARGTLRLILGMYLRSHPSQLSFLYNENGKPTVGEHWQMTDLCFNLSHTANLALYAFAYGRRLGLDIEHVRPAFDGMKLAQRKFAPGEYAALQSLPPETRTQAFFTCWTRKEAYVKASGEGIAYGLKSFEVSLKPGAPAALLSNRQDPYECARWSLQDLELQEGYVGALVVERKDQIFSCRYYESNTSLTSKTPFVL